MRLISALPETWLVYLVSMSDEDPDVTLAPLNKEEGVGISAGAHLVGQLGLASPTNLDQLPESDSVIIALPLKIEGGTGSPVRVIALVSG